eukprot:TRINITY_DN80520_c0_g1_i1.p1 TRINITY_DN80520_c0_g1~~TRINITY_DN80520_c0_g1_i1.p1  ORF type:complete len:227 (+),score=57.36 TRINITY_DN80520_c0_g1_i1:177-857(+)
MYGLGSYEPPRALKSEQIGVSSHLNTYSRGVLMGNWQEEKVVGGDYSMKAHDGIIFPKDGSVDWTTTSSLHFQRPSTVPSPRERLLQTAKRPAPLRPGMMFEHGMKPPREEFCTTTELMFQDPTKGKEHMIKTGDMIKGEFQPMRRDLLEKKRAALASERARDPKETTMRAMMKPLPIAPQPMDSKHVKKWGHFTKELGMSAASSQMRKPHYARVDAPFCRKGDLL